MAQRHLRAQINLNIMTQRSEALLNAYKTQITDTQEICEAALNGDYTPERGFADVTALWINGIALVGAFYGFGLPAGEEPE